MKRIGVLGISLILSSVFGPLLAYGAATADLVLPASSVRFSTTQFLEGRSVRIYANVTNPGNTDVRGVVRFFDGADQIQGDQPVSVLSGKDDSVFVDWVPAFAGEHNVRITAVPFEKTDSNLANNTFSKTITVLADTDRDGTPNSTDSDDDNDGVSDTLDSFPLNKNETIDTDGDAMGNNKDPDDDNDSVADSSDAFPLDPKESKDSDHDGVGDNSDPDTDGDGILNTDEIKNGTDPEKADTDGDSISDKEDAFPLDPGKAHDFDHDGIPDEQDPDADNDGIPKAQDTNDTNLGPIIEITSNGSSPTRFAFPEAKIQFESTNSSDPDGKIEVVTWTVDGTAHSGKTLETAFTTIGKHTIGLRLTDNKGESREKSLTVLVIPTFLPWIAVAVILLLIILAIFFIFSYSKPRRSKFERVTSVLEAANKALHKAKKRAIRQSGTIKKPSKK